MVIKRSEGQKARDEALARVEENADAHWKDMALQAVFKLSLFESEFSTDEVWALLTKWKVPAPHEPRALGPIMIKAVKNGWITREGYHQSTRSACHARPVRIYKGVSA